MKKEIDQILSKSKSKKKTIDLDKYFGKLKWDIDPIEYQREARKDRIEPSHIAVISFD